MLNHTAAVCRSGLNKVYLVLYVNNMVPLVNLSCNINRINNIIAYITSLNMTESNC